MIICIYLLEFVCCPKVRTREHWSELLRCSLLFGLHVCSCVYPALHVCQVLVCCICVYAIGLMCVLYHSDSAHVCA
jgi:hypothetical protein